MLTIYYGCLTIMTQVDFYILPATEPEAQLNFVCRLTEKALRKGHQIYIQAQNEAQAKALDQLLWEFRPDSFIPHLLVGDDNVEGVPVAIGHTDDCAHHHDVMINLCSHVPDHFSRFERVAEIIFQQESLLKAKRDDWRFYKERGYALNRHDMRR